MILLALAAVGLVVLCFRRAPVPSVILLPANTIIAPAASKFDRSVPRSWVWYWQAKDFVLGRARTVVIDAEFISGAPVLLPMPDQLSFLPSAVKSVTNVQIYFVHTNETASMHKEITQGVSYSMSARMSTRPGIDVKMVNGRLLGARSNNPIFSVEVVVKRAGDCTDLSTIIETTGFGDSSMRTITNLVMGARFQIPKDHAVFILKSGDGVEEPESFGVILTPRWK